MRPRHRVADAERGALEARLRAHLAGRAEIRFAILHGSFLERGAFADVDIAVSVEPGHLEGSDAIRYEMALEGELLELLKYPVDVRVLEHAPLSFRHAATRGVPVFVRDADALADFREHTWRAYLDFAPLREQALRDLLGRR